MFIFYDLIFFIFILFSLPSLWIRRRLQRDLFRRLYLSRDLKEKVEGKNPIWLHAVSVGEVMAVRKFVKELKKTTDKLIVLSTVTKTGNKLARDILGDEALVIYLPLDISFIVRHFIKIIKPAIFIAVETEIWPNLTRELAKRGIPIAVVNGRISDGAFRRYRLIRLVLKNILKRINIFCMQSEFYAQRIVFLGADREKVRISGNMKFDNVDYAVTNLHIELGMIRPQVPLLIAGSTHKGEEEILLGVYKNLLTGFPDLQLIIAPRHIERVNEVVKSVQSFNFVGIKMSQQQNIPVNYPAVFILDTIGSLSSLYALATVVFVGGSLIKKGGHNIIEPAIFAKTIIFGPYMHNFKDVSELFLSKNAAIVVNNKEELECALKELLKNSQKREMLGKMAKAVIEENRGATQKNIEFIKQIL